MKTMIKDRRTNEDRRGIKRFAVNIDIEWEGLVGRQQGTISDISSLSCFVLCSGEVENGEKVKLFIPIADGMKIEFWAEVLNHLLEIGFGARFIELSKAQRELIENFIESLS